MQRCASLFEKQQVLQQIFHTFVPENVAFQRRHDAPNVCRFGNDFSCWST
jgi:hypothetical protein